MRRMLMKLLPIHSRMRVSSKTSAYTPKIKLANVYKAFVKKKVLNGVDLEIAKGESLVVIGGSGTGKSVTLKCILGLTDVSPANSNKQANNVDNVRISYDKETGVITISK